MGRFLILQIEFLIPCGSLRPLRYCFRIAEGAKERRERKEMS